MCIYDVCVCAYITVSTSIHSPFQVAACVTTNLASRRENTWPFPLSLPSLTSRNVTTRTTTSVSPNLWSLTSGSPTRWKSWSYGLSRVKKVRSCDQIYYTINIGYSMTTVGLVHIHHKGLGVEEYN